MTTGKLKIRLLKDIPINPKHGMRRGREFEVERWGNGNAMVRGDAGELVELFTKSYQVVLQDERAVTS